MRYSFKYLFIVACLAVGLDVSAARAGNQKAAVGSPADVAIEVRDVRVDGDTVHGVVLNKSSQVAAGVRMVIRHAWLWDTERNPGTNNPGRSELYSLPEDIAPGGRAPFSYELKASKAPRDGGRFITTAEILGYTLVGP